MKILIWFSEYIETKRIKIDLTVKWITCYKFFSVSVYFQSITCLKNSLFDVKYSSFFQILNLTFVTFFSKPFLDSWDRFLCPLFSLTSVFPLEDIFKTLKTEILRKIFLPKNLHKILFFVRILCCLYIKQTSKYECCAFYIKGHAICSSITTLNINMYLLNELKMICFVL